jgi:ATP:cob(I)alamin adenosyltransferase
MIYTKKGDKGETSLFGGTKTQKDSLRVDAYGSVDEANSILGLIHAAVGFTELKDQTRTIQREMFMVGAELASDEDGLAKLKDRITEASIARLEKIIDGYTEEIGGFKGFTIPGETFCSALFHLARTVVRRSERAALRLSREETVSPLVIKYLNRLSDALYSMARAEVYNSFVRRVAVRILEIVGGAEEAYPNDQKKNNYLNIGGSKVSVNELYEKMAKAAFAEADKLKVPVDIAIVDDGGNLQYFSRQPDTLLVSTLISQSKAYTSVALKQPTANVGPLVKENAPLIGIHINEPRLVAFPGGMPLVKGGKLWGGVGISGGTVEEDQQIVDKAVEVFNDYFK